MMRASEPELVEQMEKYMAREREREKQLDQLKDRLAAAAVARLMPANGGPVISRVDGMDRQQMRSIADSLRNQKVPVVVLASVENGDVAIVAAVKKEFTTWFHAGKLAAALAQAVAGKGGGRPDMAEGGGKDISALDAALEKLRLEVESRL